MAWFSIDWVGAMLVAYTLGSIPSAYVAGRLLTGKDIRQEGDRNPGAGNAYRTIGAKAGIAVAIADIAKGAVAVLLARGITGSLGAEMAAGVAVVVGHSWPIFLKLRGGRGAASLVGVYVALVPIPAIPLTLVLLLLLPVIKSATVTLSLIMIPMPFLVWLTKGSYSLVAYCIGLPIMVGVRHYLSTRNLSRQEEKSAEGRALTQV